MPRSDDGSQAGNRRVSALELGPRRKSQPSDPLVHHGRHFARTVHALCNASALIKAGLLRSGELADEPEESFTAQERREFAVYERMLETIPGIQERLMASDGGEEVEIIASLIQKGMSQARSDDTKSMKGPILDWITDPGHHLEPPLARNTKYDRGFNHPRTGELLCPTGFAWSDEETQHKLKSGELSVPGDQWPHFLYADYQYDPEDPWKGLLRSNLLVTAFKHVFTSPSSVDKEVKATKSGNARIHGMKRVTCGSIAYIATQIRFALSSASIFSRTDTATDSERFYTSILDYLEDPEEQEEVRALLQWWNRRIFPGGEFTSRPISTNSALARIKEKRAQRRAAAGSH